MLGAPAAVVAGGLALRAYAPGVYWSSIGYPAATLGVLGTWPTVTDACGLSVRPSRVRSAVARARGRQAGHRPPRRGIPTPTRCGFTVTVRLRSGQTPADYEAAAERLRHAWGVHAVYARPAPRPGRVVLRAVAWDVLNRPKIPRRARRATLAVPVGVFEDGTTYTRDYRATPHRLVLGATQSGKSTHIRALIVELAPQPVALVGVDCKRGIELAPFADRFTALATDPGEADDLLTVLETELDSRLDLVASHAGAVDIYHLPREVQPIPVVVFVDEIAELFLIASKADTDRRDRAVRILVRIGQLGRAAGMYLEVCGQRFGSELGKGATMLRTQLSGRVCHRVNDTQTADMALADIAPEAVEAATRLRPDRPGLAVVGSDAGLWQRARTPFIPLHQAAEAVS
ncbi:MAG: FtsK/SpoIIIE domain-containing protein [Carbonactinosporaceae bacterium]